MNLRPTRMTTSEESTPSADAKPRTRKERGAVLLEAAFAIPLLIMLMFGTLEAGMAFQAKTSATAGLRSGTLRAAQLGNKPETDLAALQAVVGEVGADGLFEERWIGWARRDGCGHDIPLVNGMARR